MKKKLYFKAQEVAELLDISIARAYAIIKGMNDELEAQGYMVLSGRVPVKYFEKKFYGLTNISEDVSADEEAVIHA